MGERNTVGPIGYLYKAIHKFHVPMPKDLSIDQPMLYLAEFGESPLKILLYS